MSDEASVRSVNGRQAIRQTMRNTAGNISIAVAGAHRGRPAPGSPGRNSAILPGRRVIAVLLLTLAAAALSACSTSLQAPPAGAQEPSGSAGVTVPDDISDLDLGEVERRLGRLLGGDGVSGQAAPDVEPTVSPDGPTLQQILDLLNPANQTPGSGQIVISVSAQTLSGLLDPVLAVKSPPARGSATVVGVSQIVYMPDGAGVEGDSFEYELFDGADSVFSQVVEIR